MKIFKFLAFIGIVTMFSCGGDSDDPGTTPSEEKIPGKATLIFPNNNEECNTGIQTNDTQSVVNFSWTAATNATSYQLFVINMLNGSQLTNQSSTNNLDMVIKMNTPYRWYVVSRSNSSSVTATSDEWRFYNSGPAITTYAPFPADVVAPGMGENLNATSVNLQWSTSDVDGDLESFEVYFGTVNPPVDMIGQVTDSFMNDVAVTPNTYYWMVKRIDEEGNSSYSSVFEFKVSN